MELLEWVSVRDVCQMLGVTQPWVHVLIKAGKLRIVRTRVGILVDPRSVEEVAAQRKARTRERVAC
jgi:excisionase family DNA binding protein